VIEQRHDTIRTITATLTTSITSMNMAMSKATSRMRASRLAFGW
jgi:hypothetical protein